MAGEDNVIKTGADFFYTPHEMVVQQLDMSSGDILVDPLVADGFVIPNQEVVYNVTESVDVNFTEDEVAIMIVGVADKFPDQFYSYINDANKMGIFLSEKVAQLYNYEMNMGEIISTHEKLVHLMQMIKAGIVSGINTIRRVKSYIKVVLVTENQLVPPFVKETPYGRLCNGIPAVTYFSKETFNAVFNGFYKKYKTTNDMYTAILSNIAKNTIVNKIEENQIEDLSLDKALPLLEDVQVAEMINSGQIDMATQASTVKAMVGEKRFAKIMILQKTMKE